MTPPPPQTILQVIEFLRARHGVHYECEDPWYSCPRSPYYIGGQSLEECNCGADEAAELIEHLEAAFR